MAKRSAPAVNSVDFEEAALKYLDVGLCPILFDSVRKKPASRWKERQRERPTAAEVSAEFACWDGGIGIVTGAASGNLAVLDFDKPGAYEQWKLAYPVRARQLPTVITGRQGRQGRHVYLRTPELLRSGRFGGGDLKAKGGCVIAPPSLHASGRPYKWVVPLTNELPIVDPQDIGVTYALDRRCLEQPPPPPKHSCVSLPHCAPTSGRTCDPAAQVSAIISLTQPKAVGERNACLVKLGRYLKALPEYAEAGLGEVEPIVRRWHQKAYQVIGTKAWSETWREFVAIWGWVKVPMGSGPIERAAERALLTPPPPCAARYGNPLKRRLLALCREAQRECTQNLGKSSFFLSCRHAAAMLGCPDRYPKINRWLREFVSDGVLRRVAKHPWRTCQAAEYEYVGDRAEVAVPEAAL